MSTLQRSRSLRKPAVVSTTATGSSAPPTASSTSRLPVKPPSRSNTIATTSTTATTRSLRSGSTGVARSATLRQQGTATAAGETARKETTSSRYPPSTTTTRTRAVALRPTSSDGTTTAAQARRAPAHARAKSSTTTTATATAFKGAPVLRPPSQTGPTDSSTTTTSSTATATTTTRSAHARSTSSQNKPRTAAAATNGTTQSQTQQPRLRPAFSTLQQHYSPAKSSAPKPLTSSYLAPPSPSKLPANVAASAETSRLQTELLQLHLMHRDAAAVDVEWCASAQEKLGKRFADLAATHRELDAREADGAERDNVKALRLWAASGGGGGLEERIQTLDAVINGAWTLGEPGGRYARVVRRFERWVDGVCEVEESRRNDAAAAGMLLMPSSSEQHGEQGVLFVGELDNGWRGECAGLTRRLEGMRRQIIDMGDLPSGDDGCARQSSLRRILDGTRALVDGMLEELAVMEEMEREALAREEDWIERMNRDDGAAEAAGAGAIWRVV